MDIPRTIVAVVAGIIAYQVAVKFGIWCGTAFLLISATIFKAIFD